MGGGPPLRGGGPLFIGSGPLEEPKKVKSQSTDHLWEDLDKPFFIFLQVKGLKFEMLKQWQISTTKPEQKSVGRTWRQVEKNCNTLATCMLPEIP